MGVKLVHVRKEFIVYLKKQNIKYLPKGILTYYVVRLNDKGNKGNKIIAEQMLRELGIL